MRPLGIILTTSLAVALGLAGLVVGGGGGLVLLEAAGLLVASLLFIPDRRDDHSPSKGGNRGSTGKSSSLEG